MARSQLFVVPRQIEVALPSFSYVEKLNDHNSIIQGFLDTHVKQNHDEKTRREDERYIRKWFEGINIPDKDHPDGERQLFIWEAMEPVVGRQRINAYSLGLVALDLKHGTRRAHLSRLRRLFDYVLNLPYVPGLAVQSIIHKYGRIEQPVTKWDYPAHVVDAEDEEGYALTGDELLDFYEFIRAEYIPNRIRKFVAGRTFTMIVMVAEGGMRSDELKYVDLFGEHRDLNYEKSSIQIRHGKGANGSGKRLRKTIFSNYAQDVERAYSEHVRPKFPNANTNPALLLSETGSRLSYNSMKQDLCQVVEAARKAGFDLPPKVGMHTLRKWFASNYLEQHPERIWNLLQMMGHVNFSTLNRYILPTQEDLDETTSRVMKRILPAHVVEKMRRT
jgi:integrase